MNILVVDDEGVCRFYLERFFARAGHKCVSAPSAREALRLLKEASGTIDAVFTDIKMPQMDGIALTREITQAYPGIPVVLMTGFEDTKEVDAVRPHVVTLLGKPFHAEEIRLTIGAIEAKRAQGLATGDPGARTDAAPEKTS